MNETTDAATLFAPLWRRKWLILAVAIIVAGVTYVYYKHKPSVYSASTEIYLGGTAEERGLVSEKGVKTNISGSEVSNQAAIISSNVISGSVRKTLLKEKAHKHVAHAAASGKVSAKSKEKSDFITITAEAHNAKAAALLANTTALVYIKRQTTRAERDIKAAIAITRRQLHRIEAGSEPPASSSKSTGSSSSSSTSSPTAGTGTSAGTTSGSSQKPGGRSSSSGSSRSGSGLVSTSATLQAANLSSKINQLESELAATGVQQINPAKAKKAQLLQPKPRTNAIFAFVLGLVLASIAVYVLSRFDHRLRSLGDLERAFELQVLTALPKVSRPIVRPNGRPQPSAPLLEPLRRLHATLRLGGVAEGEQRAAPRLLLVLSADAGDGKSTLVSSLALAQRDAGERVAVVEADFRRPAQARLLDVSPSDGLAEVLAGVVDVDDAMQSVPSPAWEPPPAANGAAAGVATMVGARSAGTLSVLVSGAPVMNPPALIANPATAELLRSLADEFDCVLIDAPPPLVVSDVLPLLPVVDGIVIVARVGHTRDTSARRLVQLLARSASAPVLGIVANRVSRSEIKQYGSSSALGMWPWRRKPVRL